MTLPAAIAKPFTNDYRIVVLPFTNATDDSRFDVLQHGFSDLLVSALSDYKGIVLVEREKLHEVTEELGLSLAGHIAEDRITRIGTLMNARLLIKGSFSYHQSMLTVNAHVYDIETTRLLASAQKSGKIADVANIGRTVARRLIKGLNKSNSQFTDLAVDEAPELYLHFMKGLGYYYSQLYDHAVAEFMLVHFLQPGHAEARFWIGKSYYDNEEFDHARIEFETFLKEHKNHPRAADVRSLLRTIQR